MPQDADALFLVINRGILLGVLGRLVLAVGSLGFVRAFARINQRQLGKTNLK